MEHIYSGTDKAVEGVLRFEGKPKTYLMGWMQGYPHVEVASYYGQGVTVSYLMTGVTYSWQWADKEQAWAFAKGRSFHIDEIKAAGNAYANRAN